MKPTTIASVAITAAALTNQVSGASTNKIELATTMAAESGANQVVDNNIKRGPRHRRRLRHEARDGVTGSAPHSNGSGNNNQSGPSRSCCVIM